MTTGPKLSVLHCIVCDDVRTEVGNKEILIGVYTAGMTFPTLPWIGTLSLWLSVMWSGEGQMTVEIRILNPRQAVVGAMDGVFHAIWRGFQSSLSFRNIMIDFEIEGTYEIQWRPAGGNWETMRQFPIFIAKS